MTIVHRDDSGTRDERRRRLGVVSPVVRWSITGVSLLSVLCFSGIIFGWAPLELMLLEEDQYNYETTAVQLQKLNIIFTVAQFLLSFASLPIGLLLDLVPKPLYFGVAGLCEITGLILFALSDSSTTSSTTRSTSASEQESNQAQDHDHFLLGYSLLAVGGCMTLLGAYPASFLLPHYQAGILVRTLRCIDDDRAQSIHEPHSKPCFCKFVTKTDDILIHHICSLYLAPFSNVIYTGKYLVSV